jgi:hypothetical protein
VRSAAIDVAEWLVREKVTTETVLAWRSIAQSLGVTGESLAQAVAAAIRDVGSAELARQRAHAERAALVDEQVSLKAANTALRKEQAAIHAALKAVTEEGDARVAAAAQTARAAIAVSRDQAVRSIQAVESTLTRAIEDADGRIAAALDRYRALTEEAGRLEAQVAFARALNSEDLEAWRSVRPVEWAALLAQLERWMEAVGADPAAPPVGSLSTEAANRIRYPSLYGEIRLSDLAVWMRLGLRDMNLPAFRAALPAEAVAGTSIVRR